MPAYSFGLTWNTRNGTSGRPVIADTNMHIMLFGPNRSGKGAAIEIPNLLRLGASRRDRVSVISLDPKGQNAAVTARWRRKVSNVVILNPFDLLKLGDVGFNPLVYVNTYEDAASIAEALIRVDGDKDPFFPESARGLMLCLILFEVMLARAAKRPPLLANVRAMLTGDLPATATDMVATGHFQLASMANRFREQNKTNDGIIATADTQTRWLLSEPMRASLAKNGIDFGTLKKTPTTVYVILDADKLEMFSVWLRLVVVSALNALYRQGGSGLRTLFMLSEFAQLGHLKPITAALGQGAGYGIQLLPVLQDMNQLRSIYGRDAHGKRPPRLRWH